MRCLLCWSKGNKEVICDECSLINTKRKIEIALYAVEQKEKKAEQRKLRKLSTGK